MPRRYLTSFNEEDNNQCQNNETFSRSERRCKLKFQEPKPFEPVNAPKRKNIPLEDFERPDFTKFPASDEEMFFLEDKASSLKIPRRRIRKIDDPSIVPLPKLPPPQLLIRPVVGELPPNPKIAKDTTHSINISRGSASTPKSFDMFTSIGGALKPRSGYRQLGQEEVGIELEDLPPNHITNPEDTLQSQNINFSNDETTNTINDIDDILTRARPPQADVGVPRIAPPELPAPPQTPDMPRSLLDTDTPETSSFRQLEEAVRGRIPSIMEEPVETRPMNIQELSIGNPTIDSIPNIDPTERITPAPRPDDEFEDPEEELSRTRERLKRRGLTNEQIEDQIAEDRMFNLQEQSFRDQQELEEGRTSVRSIREMFQRMESVDITPSNIPRMRGRTNAILAEESAMRASRHASAQQDRERIQDEIRQAHEQRAVTEQQENDIIEKIREFVSTSDNAELTQNNIDDIFEEFDGKIPREKIAQIIKEYTETRGGAGSSSSSRTQELLGRIRTARTLEIERFVPPQRETFTDVAFDDEPAVSRPRPTFGRSLGGYEPINFQDDNFTTPVDEIPKFTLPDLPSIPKIRSRFTPRVFSQPQTRYEPIAPEEPFQNIELTEVRQPLNEPTTGGSRTFAQSLRRGLPVIKAPPMEQVVGSGKTIGVGIVAGFGISELMEQAGVHNPYVKGAVSGAGAGAFARVASMGDSAVSRTVTRTGANLATEVTESAFSIAGRGSRVFLQGAVEGGVTALALMPLGDFISKKVLLAGGNHATAGGVSAGATGAIGTVGTTIMLASLGSAPETLGMSLIVGTIATGVSTLVGVAMGGVQDQEAQRQRDAEAEKATTRNRNVAYARAELMRSLPDYDYNFNHALMAYRQIHYASTRYADLGEDQADWASFSARANYTFNPKPSNTPYQEPTDDSNIPPSDPALLANFQQYVNRQIMITACAGSTSDSCNAQRNDRRYAPLQKAQIRLLDLKTNDTWRQQADVIVQQSIAEATYTQQRTANAQKQLEEAWDTDTRTFSQIKDGDYLMQTASLDANFRQRYDNRIMISAQQQIVDAYVESGGVTTLDMIPGAKGNQLRRVANTDPGWQNAIQAYYRSVNTTARQMNLSNAQFLEIDALQRTDPSTKGYIEPAKRYKQMQFKNAQSDENVVTKATALATQEDQVRQLGYYDIDQAMLETDPTAPSNWNPSDSQILQAHMAGMTLQQYVDYMHELSRGKEGDYSNLPKYNYEMLRGAGLDDFRHFQDELQLAGYDRNLYDYNVKTRTFTLNPNKQGVLRIPSINNSFVSAYTPQSLLDSRANYSTMIQGINRHDQAEVDIWNASLHKQINAQGLHYDQQVANYNSQAIYEGRSDLLYYNSELAYRANMEHFIPFSKDLKDATKNKNKYLDKSEFKSTREIMLEEQAKERKANERKLESEIQSATALGMNLDTYLREKTLITKVIKDEKREKQQVNYADATQRAIAKANAEATTIVQSAQDKTLPADLKKTGGAGKFARPAGGLKTTNQTPATAPAPAPTTSTPPPP